MGDKRDCSAAREKEGKERGVSREQREKQAGCPRLTEELRSRYDDSIGSVLMLTDPDAGAVGGEKGRNNRILVKKKSELLLPLSRVAVDLVGAGAFFPLAISIHDFSVFADERGKTPPPILSHAGGDLFRGAIASFATCPKWQEVLRVSAASALYSRCGSIPRQATAVAVLHLCAARSSSVSAGTSTVSA